jgi:hypothetical protein
MALVIGDPPNADYTGVTSWTGNSVTTGAVLQNWPVDTTVRVREIGHQGSTPIPYDRLLFHSIWFPAMSVNIGTPSGPLQTAWKTVAEYGGSAGSINMTRRDYAGGPYGNAVVIMRPITSVTSPRIDECSTNAVSLNGTFYRLQSDGRTEATPYTTIKLR